MRSTEGPQGRAGLGPGEQSVFITLQLLSPILLPDFQDSHFPPTRPKAEQPSAGRLVSAQGRDLAWEERTWAG